MTVDTTMKTKLNNTKSDLGVFFKPRSIAILGASTDPNKIGGVPIAALKRANFSGRILPVNPNQTMVQDLPAYPSILDVPEDVDLAIVALAAKSALQSVKDCLSKGVRGIVMFTSGLGEVSEEGKALQAEIVATCRAGGARILGPNSLGIFSPYGGIFTTFSASLQHTWPIKGKIAIVSQSGAVGSFIYAMLHERELGISRFVATGNEGDVDTADCIDWFADDPETTVIIVYIEGVKIGVALRAALLKARRLGKPVIVLKVGNSEAGAKAVASHTGSLAGSSSAFSAVFAEAAVYQAKSMAEVVDITEAAVAGPPPKGKRLGVITPSGGVGIMLTDQAQEAGLLMPPLPVGTQQQILALVPFANPTNPVDTTAQVVNDMSLMSRIHDLMMEGGRYDIMISFLVHMGRNKGIMDQLIPPLTAMRQRYPETVFIISTFTTPETKKKLRDAGFLVYDEPTQALHVAAGMCHLWQEPKPVVPVDMSSRLVLTDETFDEAQSMQLLSNYGISFPPSGVAMGAVEAGIIATKIGFPVALKVISSDIPHKSDIGGVVLGLNSAVDVTNAYEAMMKRVAHSVPEAKLSGALVTCMVGGGIETVIGSYNDPAFGPLVMFGLGGVYVEAFKDVVFRPAPVNRSGAIEMINSINAHQLLTMGTRGIPPVDIESLANAIINVSQIAAANSDQIATIEINPFLAKSTGGIALDALFQRRLED